MQIVPIQPVPSQIVSVALAGQACQISIYLRGATLYVDLSVNNATIIDGVAARNKNRIVRSLYLGFVGDLTFLDNQGSEDPQYTGLGTRWSLAYLETSDLRPGEG